MFNNVSWSANENLDSQKLNRMTANDQECLRLGLLAPTGLLVSGDARTVSGKSRATPPTTSLGVLDVDNKYYIPEDMPRFYQINVGQFEIRYIEGRAFIGLGGGGPQQTNWPRYLRMNVFFNIIYPGQQSVFKRIVFQHPVAPRQGWVSNAHNWSTNQASRRIIAGDPGSVGFPGTPYFTQNGQLYFSTKIVPSGFEDKRNKFSIEIGLGTRSNSFNSGTTAEDSMYEFYGEPFIGPTEFTAPISIEDIGGDPSYAGLP